MDYSERTPSYLKAPIALVIGCGDMGMACARALGRRAPLLIVDIDSDRLDQSVATLRREGHAVTSLCCDISDIDDIGDLAAHLATTGTGVRALAHVAAVGNPPGGWRTVMQVDLIGAHLVARAVARHMVPGGVAVLISSTGSYQCPVDPALDALIDAPLKPDFLECLVATLGREPELLEAYFIAKQGVNRLARRLAIDWGPRDVRAVSVSPGLIDSTMGRTSGRSLPVNDGQTAKAEATRSEKAAREVPLGRQGSVLEVMAVVDFLASDAASFISGIDLPVDGGSTALRRSRGTIAR